MASSSDADAESGSDDGIRVPQCADNLQHFNQLAADGGVRGPAVFFADKRLSQILFKKLLLDNNILNEAKWAPQVFRRTNDCLRCIWAHEREARE